jgi:hypothetical protein
VLDVAIMTRKAGVLRTMTAVAIIGAIACGPSRGEFESQKQTIADLRRENAKLRGRALELEAAAQEAPDILFRRLQDAHGRKDYEAALKSGEALLAKHPASDRAPATQRLVVAARKKLAEAEARRRAEVERLQKRDREAARAVQSQRIAEVRRLLDRNLNGAGDGFVRGWRWSEDTFTLIIDERRYVPNSAVVAAMTARSIFDTGDVALPSVLIFRDRNGNELDRGPFANVPRVTP